MSEPAEVADLRAEPGGGQRVDPAQAHQPPGALRPRGERQLLGDLTLELFATNQERLDRSAIVLERGLGPSLLATVLAAELERVRLEYNSVRLHEAIGYVTPDDIRALGLDVLRHRVILTYEAEAENTTSEDIVRRIFDRVEVP